MIRLPLIALPATLSAANGGLTPEACGSSRIGHIYGDGALAQVRVASAELCCDACLASERCAAFTYHNDGRCFLKDNANDNGPCPDNCTSALAGAGPAPPPPPLPVATEAQARWAEAGYGAFIHFGMETLEDGGGGVCQENWEAQRDPSYFNPEALDTDAWIQEVKRFGAGYAVLTVKHCCGFVLYPTNVTLPNGERYNYSVAYSKWRDGKGDVVSDFIASCKKYGVRPGFYFSLGCNQFLNTRNNKVGPSSTLRPGQVELSQDEYYNVTLAMVDELWSTYGEGVDLGEVWFDGGFADAEAAHLSSIVSRDIPETVALNGYGVSPNAVRWIGNEYARVPDEVWSTGSCTMGQPGGPKVPPGGQVDSADFCPAECPYTIQSKDTWFYWEPASVHSLQELQDMFHATTGRNCNPIVDFAPMQSGALAKEHVQRWHEFSAWLSGCYGSPVAETLGNASVLTLDLPETSGAVDRVWLSEDVRAGQRVRAWQVMAQCGQDPPSIAAQGTSIGSHWIAFMSQPIESGCTLVFNATQSIGVPVMRRVAAFGAASCSLPFVV